MVIPQRGLRQGDPLSSFLFVLCTEGLSYLLNSAQRDGLISGIRFNDDGPTINHLLFADDSLFLCKANKDQSLVLQKILKVYGDATGQTINFDKSSITFGGKVTDLMRTEVKVSLGILNEGGAGTYLGLPECFSGSKVEMLGYIKDRLKSKLSGWFSRSLSLGGKEILLKSVALAMPVFAMSCFKLPKTTCDNLSSAMAAFWWSAYEDKRKIHWLSWDKLCLPKHLGGLGFRDIQLFNQSLLAKQAWRLIQYPDCIFSRFIKSRYFPNSDFLDACLGGRPSFGWRSIIHGRDLLIKGLIKNIGNGASICVWVDRWLNDDDGMRAPWIKNTFINPDLRVKELIDVSRRDWDLQKLNFHFFPEDVNRIRLLKPVVSVDDFWSWKFNKSGDYSVKSGFWLAMETFKASSLQVASVQPSLNPLKEQVWKLQTDPKIKVFLWKVSSGALPVADLLSHRGMKIDDRCQTCGLQGESIGHALFSCSLSRQIWALSDFPSPPFGMDSVSIFSMIHHLLINRSNLKWPPMLRKSFPWIIWRIWKNRNIFFFEGKRFTALETVAKIKEDVEEWFLAQVIEEEEKSNQLSRPVSSSDSSQSISGSPWSPPICGWLKCNVGVSWSKRNRMAGCAWVLRDEKGLVLFHSRRAFSNIVSCQDANLIGLLWAIDSMCSHRINKVFFALEDVVLLGAVLRPKAWPSFRFQRELILDTLRLIPIRRLVLESASANRGTSLIAKSVTTDGRVHSYVASGFPSWLSGVFCDERV
ncbi:Ribonuclease H domain [Arabidopsis suecica]|uniref:Ribonuclease H domain n=1 Tax=Arabidopsis suecica TaxID=45249 RepID=A0A8T1YNP7_ARASU|nr:Ribonuclease H domain [Arabidopsis suecica]